MALSMSCPSVPKQASELILHSETFLLRSSPPSLGRDTLGLGTPGTLWGWALRGHSGVGHSRETLGLGTPGDWGFGILGGESPLVLGTPGMSEE